MNKELIEGEFKEFENKLTEADSTPRQGIINQDVNVRHYMEAAHTIIRLRGEVLTGRISAEYSATLNEMDDRIKSVYTKLFNFYLSTEAIA